MLPANYDYLRECVYRDSGIVLDGDKRYLLEARLAPVLHQRALGTIDDLCTVLRGTPDAALRSAVVDAMTTNETFFFRDPAQYEALKTTLLPQLRSLRLGGRRLSVWSAAASTGQEAYSLAMSLLESGMSGADVQILGTDLSERVLAKAESGRYFQIEVNRGLPAALLVKHFTRAGLDWQLSAQVRSMARFTRFDLRESMRALGPFDIVFCRNVLIYFDVETKKQILRGLRSTLFEGGYLLLGGSETVLGLSTDFEQVTLGRAVAYRAA